MKMSELSSMSLDELEIKKLELSEKFFLYRCQKQLGKLDKPIQLRFLRRTIARINTLLSAKERRGVDDSFS